jgi:hypothetical protein
MPRAKHAQGYSAARACTLSTYLITQAAPELQAQLECLDRLPHLLAAKPGCALSPIDGPPAAASTATVRSGRLAPDAMRCDGMGSAGAVGSAPLPQSNGARRAETGTSPRHSAPTAVSTRCCHRARAAGRGGLQQRSDPKGTLRRHLIPQLAEEGERLHLVLDRQVKLAAAYTERADPRRSEPPQLPPSQCRMGCGGAAAYLHAPHVSESC